VDVNVLIRDVVGLAQQKAVEQGIEIRVEGPTAIPRLHVDPAQVKTCLMNVVLNAIQAMPAGGILAVRVAYRPDGPGGEDEKTPGGVEVLVSDTGSGISEEELGKIFNPYFTTKKLGIGLGLAITKKIVEEHGGQISVMSRAHEGTTVVIRFPLDEVTEVAV
jgi:signal transduction histidine kinase